MAETDSGMADDFPTELQDRLSSFDDGLTTIEEMLAPLHGVPLSQIHVNMSPLDKAKLDLIGVYAVNSLFWMYLNVKGVNPKEHGVKQELDRIRSYMNRVREIEEKAKAPKLDKEASKRFMRNALWQQAHRQSQEQAVKSEEPQPSTSEEMDVSQEDSNASKHLKKKKRRMKKK